MININRLNHRQSNQIRWIKGTESLQAGAHKLLYNKGLIIERRFTYRPKRISLGFTFKYLIKEIDTGDGSGWNVAQNL